MKFRVMEDCKSRTRILFYHVGNRDPPLKNLKIKVLWEMI